MTSHSSATTREQTPHVNRTTRTATIMDALVRRWQSILNDESIDAQSRAIIRYGLETNDPWLADLVRRREASESLTDTVNFSQTPDVNEGDVTLETGQGALNTDKIEALAEMICRGCDESAAALLVLMGRFEKSSNPKALANTVKHFAFTRCGELNFDGMVDAQIVALEAELLVGDTRRV